MQSSPLIVSVAIALSAVSQAMAVDAFINPAETRSQSECYRKHFGKELIWRFDELPVSGTVPAHRMPYAGYIYPYGFGGTERPLRKYDLAFHRGDDLAASSEREFIARHRVPVVTRTAFRQQRYYVTPDWAGHCNGWTAAAIRHAEPRTSVTVNGVVFTPADIKGLLAELYMHTNVAFLGGEDDAINPGLLHVSLCNWLGRGQHPVAMDTTPGEVAWNYPIYAYSSDSARRGRGRVEVKVNLGYVYMLDHEYERSPKNFRFMFLHYDLDLNADGEIVGGRYHHDSSQIDLLWVPLKPAQGATRGNPEGNPYLDVNEVLAIWRQSVPTEIRDKWSNIDDTAESPAAGEITR